MRSVSDLKIERIEVEEGFLDGLDLTFDPKLNVLIGPRGSGKTSVVELIRFCLGVEAIASPVQRAAREHALSVLGSGRVVVTLSLENERLRIRRSQGDPLPETVDPTPSPVVFSQNEIEAVGLEAEGRLRVLDGFLDLRDDDLDAERATDSEVQPAIRSLTSEIAQLTSQMDAAEERLAELSEVEKELASAKEARAEVLESVNAAKKDREKLTEVAEASAAASVRQDVLEDALGILREWHGGMARMAFDEPALPGWPEAAGEVDQLAEARAEIKRALAGVQRSIDGAQRIVEDVQSLTDKNQEARRELEDMARALRRSLEQLQEGAGAAALSVSNLEEKASQAKALNSRRRDLEAALEALQQERGALYDRLEAQRTRRFDARRRVARKASAELGPVIRIDVARGGAGTEYTSAVREGLRGSGIHYNTLAPLIAERMSPRELAEVIEAGNVELLVKVLEISQGRAQRIVSVLRNVDLAKLLTIAVHDSVTMSLLDGRESKATPELSTGQRCTVILSILLAQAGPPLVVDQPEDNLDNAFVVETLIQAILRAKLDRQLIFTTHNPNIPVLGQAERVVCLGSDGRRGFVRHAEALDHPESVSAITTIMEGGEEAFARRARFYGLKT